MKLQTAPREALSRIQNDPGHQAYEQWLDERLVLQLPVPWLLALLQDSRVTDSAKLIAIGHALAGLFAQTQAGPHRTALPRGAHSKSRNALARDLPYSPETLTRATRALKKAGYVRIEQIEGRGTVTALRVTESLRESTGPRYARQSRSARSEKPHPAPARPLDAQSTSPPAERPTPTPADDLQALRQQFAQHQRSALRKMDQTALLAAYRAHAEATNAYVDLALLDEPGDPWPRLKGAIEAWLDARCNHIDPKEFDQWAAGQGVDVAQLMNQALQHTTSTDQPRWQSLPRRKPTPALCQDVRQAVSEVAQAVQASQPERLIQEVIYSLTDGVQRGPQGTYAKQLARACEWIRAGTWRTPRGFSSKHPVQPTPGLS